MLTDQFHLLSIPVSPGLFLMRKNSHNKNSGLSKKFKARRSLKLLRALLLILNF